MDSPVSYGGYSDDRSPSRRRSLSRSRSPIRHRSRSRSPLEIDEEWGVMNVKLSSAWSWSSSRELFRTDWKETATEYVFKADVPGLTEGDLTVEVEDGRLLNLRGERRVSAIENSTTSSETINRHTERKSGRFARRFLLRHNVDVRTVKAEMERGVLTVTLPKAGRKIIAIPLSG
ncbi:hypothetical protein COLO4_15108 [Corchorus olitorius]|uniref:SHSP domain-containing protein n=1 Tax=Corchorus olitorius TaxID=93759 RepID=A0A1R3JPJ7_9ROSI|nr:hypothetical protein COLO4_15108 [Corchorus olitorius]